MTMPVGVHCVSRAEDACQRAGNGRVCEDLGQFGNSWQNTVAWIAFDCEYRLGAATNRLMEGARKVGLYRHETIDDEILHLTVIEKDHWD